MYLGLLNLHAFALLFSPTSVSQAMLSTVGILLLKGIPLRFNPSCNRSEVINESSKLNAFAFHSLMLWSCWGTPGASCPAWGWAGSREAARQAGSALQSSQGCQSPSSSHRGQTQGWALPGQQPQLELQPSHPGGCSQPLVSSWCPGTGQGTPRGKGLQRLLVHLGPGNVSSSHVFFQLSFTVNYKWNYFFFLCIFVF